jgi:hypothetical protein
VFGEVALRLHDLGWRPLPCAGKVAILSCWNELCRIPWDRGDLINAINEFTTFNCGIAASVQLVFLDLDISDLQLAHDVAGLADRLLGHTPLTRVGQAPRQVNIYRNGSPGHVRSGRPHPIEIMAGSGMVIAFGVHPGTGRAYEWTTGCSPLTTAANSTDIPLLHHVQLQRFLSDAGRLLARAHYGVHGRTHARQGAGDRTVFLDVRHRLRIDTQIIGFERAAIRLLRSACEGNRHITAFEVACSAAGRGWDEGRIVRLFEDHFAGWGGVSDDAFRRILDRAFRGDRHV